MVESSWKTVWTALRKIKHTLIIQSNNQAHGYLSPKNENLHPHKNLYINIHIRCTHNSQKLETTKMPFNDGVVKLVAAHLCCGPCNKKEWIPDTHNSDGSQGHYPEWGRKTKRVSLKKLHTIRFHLYNILQMTKLWDGTPNRGLHGSGMGRAG